MLLAQILEKKKDDSLLGNFCVEIVRLIAAYLLNGAKIVSGSKKYDAFFSALNIIAIAVSQY